MIRHIVFFGARDPADRERIVAGLSTLKGIPIPRRLEIALNRRSDPLSKEVDVVVYGEFDSDDDLAAYKAHPLYQRSIELVRPLRELRLAVDFESAE